MNELLDKGRVAARSARLLLEAADSDGAVNRAYYSIFHIARARLEQINPELVKAKRHATVVGRFGKYMVRERGFDAVLGRAFSLALDLRVIADYERKTVDPADAREILHSAENFLEALAGNERGSDENDQTHR